eukprot:m.44877 g.44877  ORF g.44877 m.44877 type:complete len:326 (+) comp10857_c0_seq1:151-1128(+)
MAFNKVTLAFAVVAVVVLAIVGHADAAGCGASCQARTKRMVDLSKKTPLIKLTGSMYSELLQTRPRNYDVVLVLNALHPQRQCQHCSAAHAELMATANSFREAYPDDDKLFFAYADFDSNQDIFQKLKCNSAPVYYHIAPTGKPQRHNQQMIAGEEVAAYVASITGQKFTVNRPFNWFKLFVTLLVVGSIGAFCYFAWDVVMQVASNTTMWAVLAIFFSLLMMSGHMWLQIRGAPYVGNDNGKPAVFSGTSQYQYGAESHAVIVLYGTVTAALVVLLEAGRNSKGDMSRLFMYTIIGCVVLFFGFRYLYECFRTKYGGYPLRLIF